MGELYRTPRTAILSALRILSIRSLIVRSSVPRRYRIDCISADAGSAVPRSRTWAQ